MKHLRTVLRQRREYLGMSLRDLEAASGVGNATICQIETGYVKEPGFRNMVRLADALGLSLDLLAQTK